MLFLDYGNAVDIFLAHDDKSRKCGIGLLGASNAWNEEHMKATFVKKNVLQFLCFVMNSFGLWMT